VARQTRWPAKPSGPPNPVARQTRWPNPAAGRTQWPAKPGGRPQSENGRRLVGEQTPQKLEGSQPQPGGLRGIGQEDLRSLGRGRAQGEEAQLIVEGESVKQMELPDVSAAGDTDIQQAAHRPHAQHGFETKGVLEKSGALALVHRNGRGGEQGQLHPRAFLVVEGMAHNPQRDPVPLRRIGKERRAAVTGELHHGAQREAVARRGLRGLAFGVPELAEDAPRPVDEAPAGGHVDPQQDGQAASQEEDLLQLVPGFSTPLVTAGNDAVNRPARQAGKAPLDQAANWKMKSFSTGRKEPAKFSNALTAQDG